MTDRNILVGSINPVNGMTTHGVFEEGDVLVDPLGNPLVDIATAWYYGNGEDGDVTIAVDTTLSANYMYNNLTINAGVALTLQGHYVMVKGTLTLEAGAVIRRNGNSATSGLGGAALAAAVYGESGAGANAQGGGTNLTVSLGGAGGKGGASNVGATNGPPGGTVTGPAAANGGLINRAHLQALTTGTVIGSNSAKMKGGSGGGGSATLNGGAGGGGGPIVIFARLIVVTSGTASITSNGGNGRQTVTANSSGGGGGGGGFVIVVSSAAQPAGLSLVANGGLGGLGSGGLFLDGLPGNPGFTAFYVWNELKETP